MKSSVTEASARGAPRWALYGLGAYAIAVAMIVTLPVGYADMVATIGDWLRARLGLDGFGYGWIEFVANILMVVPVGFFLAVIWRRFWLVIALLIVCATVVEILQLVIPGRTASLRDVVANSVGAAVGVAVGRLATRRARRARTRR